MGKADGGGFDAAGLDDGHGHVLLIAGILCGVLWRESVMEGKGSLLVQ